MREELISFKRKTSRFAIFLALIASGIILLLLGMAEIRTIFKLILLLIATIIVSLGYFNNLKCRISGGDLLLQLQEAIVWKDRQTYLAKIVALRQIGYLAIILTFQINNRRETAVLFFDSIDQLSYKHLMRHIKWQSPALNSN